MPDEPRRRSTRFLDEPDARVPAQAPLEELLQGGSEVDQLLASELLDSLSADAASNDDRPSERWWSRPRGLIGIGLAAGTLARLFEVDSWQLGPPTIFAAIGLVLFSLWSAAGTGDEETPARLQIKNLLLWFAWAMGWWLLSDGPTTQATQTFFDLTLAAGVCGAVAAGIYGRLNAEAAALESVRVAEAAARNEIVPAPSSTSADLEDEDDTGSESVAVIRDLLRQPGIRRAATLTAAAWAGIVSRSAEPWVIFNAVGSATILGIVVVLLLTWLVAVENRAAKGMSLVWYHLQNLGLWLSFALGWILVIPEDSMLGGEWEFALAIILCASLGPLLRSWRTPDRDVDSAVQPAGSAAG